MEKKQDIRNLSYDELVLYLKGVGEKSFRATQIFKWLYKDVVWSFDEMKNLSLDLREKLSKDFILQPLTILKKEISKDGTIKFLFELDDKERIETVLIPSPKRTTVCLSTQAGCKFGCKFCASGIGGFKRNLTTAEIMAQTLHVKEEAHKNASPLTNIVYMGVGEPLDNFDNVIKSVRLINGNKGLNIGARKITISTCGVIPKMKVLALEGLQVGLAISLHGYNNESRNMLMPVNRKYPFDKLMEACREYINITKRQITFEYILIKDVTCTPAAIGKLKTAFRGLICKMNLIPLNPVNEFGLAAPSKQEVVAFQKQLTEFGIISTIRVSRGQDIDSACGQLRNA